MKMNVIEKNVAKLLQENPAFRNDDRLLIFGYWNKVERIKIKMPSIPFTSPETIRRVRQKLQSEGYFLPTDPNVLKRRRKQETKIRSWCKKK